VCLGSLNIKERNRIGNQIDPENTFRAIDCNEARMILRNFKKRGSL